MRVRRRSNPVGIVDVPQTENRDTENRATTVTPAPGTVGINLDPIRPAVFAPSVADKLQVDMPTVKSGTYATGTVSTSVTGDAVAKGADVPQTAGAITVGSTTPKRVGASIAWAAEDIAAIGADNFEALTRANVSLVLSDELDNQILNGTGADDDLTGLFKRLDDPNAPAAGVATFDGFLGAFAGCIEGLWASQMNEVSIVAGPDTYRLSAKTFRDATGQDLGAIAFADYAKQHTAGWWTNKRMPEKKTHIQQAIACRKGRSMRTAVAPQWGYMSVDDIYTGGRKGERYFTVSVLVGDVLLVQPDAYSQVSFRVSA